MRKLWFVMISHRLVACECGPQVCGFFQTCTDGLRCVEIHCPLQGLDSTATVVLHSRLWNTTFVEVGPDLSFIFLHWYFFLFLFFTSSVLFQDYSTFNYLVIAVDASLSLTNSPDNTRLKSDRLSTQVKSKNGQITLNPSAVQNDYFWIHLYIMIHRWS